MRNRAMVLLVLVPAVMGLSACGGDNKGKDVASGGGNVSASATPGANAPINPQDAQVKFAQCMRENGVNVPDPQPGQPARIEDTSGDKAKLESATKKCQPVLQQGGGMINPSDPKVQDALLKFTKCMREHGVNIPDPGPDGKMQVPSGSQAKLQAAQQQCQQFLPGGGPK
jgi:hypothetical protein